MIRILCVFGGLNRGGSETMCMDIYRNIDRSKIQFDFVKHTNKKCDYEEEIKSLGGNIYTAPEFKIYNIISYCKWWKDFFSKHPEYGIVHGHYFTIAAVYFRIAHKYGLKTIGHSHSAKTSIKTIKDLIKRLFTNALKYYSDYCFACGEDAGKYVFGKRRFKVINNAINTSAYVYNPIKRRKVRKELGLEQDDFVLGTVGRITFQKNPYMIINILKALKDRNVNFRFLWVGKGDMGDVIQNEVHRCNLDKYVRFLGVRDDVPDLLQAMDIFLFPSLWEGLPVTLVEAQNAGLRIICSENITKEVDMTNLITYISLSDSEDKWVDEILKYKNGYSRLDTQQEIIDHGYDISNTSKWLENFYLKVYEKQVKT